MAHVIRRSVLVALMLTATSSAALAQGNAADSEAAPATAKAANRRDDDARIAEIVVTASRFSESAQRSSSAISVIGNDRLAGITELRQLQSLDPGVQLGVAGGVNQTFVRGVGSFSLNNLQESSVSYNVDGVFLFSSTMITPLMYDLQRIEVLKGPQGTLYGRNASGGVVNLVTAPARLGTTEGYVEAELGNYDLRRIVGAVNLPLSPTLSLRFAGQHVEHDGYLSDGTDDQNQTSGRLRLLWEPSSAVTFQLGADISRIRAMGFGASTNPNPTGDKFVGSLDPRLVGTGFGLFTLPPNPPPFLKDDQWSVNAQLDVDLGFATLTLLPAYRHQDLEYRAYTPFFENRESPRTEQKTLEARLANRNDKLKWVVGAYYLKVDQKDVSRTRAELIGLDSTAPDFRQDIESYAFFGEATYSLTDTLRVIAGLRYTHEKSDASTTVNNQSPFVGGTPAYNPFDPITNPTGEFLDYAFAAAQSAQAVTWKGGVEFDVAPNSLLFATASRGFKGGGTYIDSPPNNPVFQPEKVIAFEFGSRNRFFNDTLQVNGGLFYWKLKNQQIPYTGYNNAGQVTLIIANAGQAHMYGGNVDVIWRPTPNDTLRGAVEYLRSQYDEFVRFGPSALVVSPTACNLSGYVAGTFAPATIDCSGLPVVRAPKVAASAGYQHRFDLQSSGEILADADLTYASGRYLSPDYSPFSYQPKAALMNASLTYTTGSRAFSIKAWIRNIGNRRIMSGGGATTGTSAQVTLQPPRTFGVSARYSF